MRNLTSVSSFGFIEHFVNWKEILTQQARLVNNGGYLVVEAPNFYGLIQKMLHWFFDKENYKRHYVPSMSPQALGQGITRLKF